MTALHEDHPLPQVILEVMHPTHVASRGNLATYICTLL